MQLQWCVLPFQLHCRFQHSHLAVGKKLVYFGGWDGTTSFNDLWVYDTGAWGAPQIAMH